MKKLIAVTSAVVLTAMLCGCASSDITSSELLTDISVTESSSADETLSHSSTKWTAVQVADNNSSCEGLVLTALNAGSFPEMVKATDSAILDTIMDFSKYGITDYCVYQQAISVELSEVIAVRADDADGVYDALMARKTSLIKQFATYPEQAENANQTVVFKKGDLCILIASSNSTAAQKAVINKLKANAETSSVYES